MLGRVYVAMTLVAVVNGASPEKPRPKAKHFIFYKKI